MSNLRVTAWATAALAALVLLPATAAATPTITETSSGITSGRDPLNLVAAGGNVWFTENGGRGGVGRITPQGVVDEFVTGITAFSDPWGIAAGADNNVWFTESANPGRIGRITPAGSVTQFVAGLTQNSVPLEITAGPDGNLWFTESTDPGRIGRITPQGVITEFSSGLTKNKAPWAITAGPDGNLWFTENKNPGRIGRITPQGVISELPSGVSSGTVTDITAGPDGNLWFTVAAPSPKIGRMTPQGTATLFSSGLTAASNPQSITAGADGNIYFTEKDGPAIGKITPAGTITEYGGSGLHSYASPWGITTGADGRLWFSDLDGFGAIGSMTVGPGVGSVDATAVTDTSASVATTVRPNSEATTVTFEIGTTTAYGQSASASAGSGGATIPVTATFNTLAASTLYHVRMVATNATDTTFGPDLAFTTTAPGAPVATTGAADGISPSDATLNGVVNPNSGATTYHFEWGPTQTYGTSVPASDAAVGSDTTDHVLAQAITGLQPNTTYHFRIVAAGPGGVTDGLDQTFTTGTVAPLATTDAATAITGTAAQFNGTVNPRFSPSDVQFQWGTAPGIYDTSANLPSPGAGADGSDHAMSYAADALEPNTTYYFRVVALGAAGTTAGSELSFITDAVAPVAATGAADGVTDSAATLTGTANPRNSASTYRFELGSTTAYDRSFGESGQDVGDDDSDHALTQAVTGLAPDTTYHYRVVSTNAAGTTHGEDRTFTTAPLPLRLDESPTGGPDVTPLTGPIPPVKRPVPAIGRTVVVGATRGTVRVQVPGSTSFVALNGSSAVPSGAILDTRAGTVALTTALDATGRTQRATFRGGVFQVRQPSNERGMTDITLRGGSFAKCRATVRAPQPRFAVAAKRKPVRGLWASDNHGRFRSHGRSSVATVRGTSWYTEDRCEGTLTRVSKGAVDVRDRRSGKTFRVRAGHSHLARV